MLSLLPPEVLYVVFSYCDVQTLGRLRCVSSRLNVLLSASYLWIQKSENILATNQRDQRMIERSRHVLGPVEKCWQSIRWKTGRYRESTLVRHSKRFIPWLHMERDALWYTQGDCIFRFFRSADGGIQERSMLLLRGHADDVGHFVCKDGLCISGGNDGSIIVRNSSSGMALHPILHCHSKPISSVDVSKNIVVTGSRDKTVKVWTLDEQHAFTLAYYIYIWDRVCSVAIMEEKQLFLSGSAGCNGAPPLQAFDLTTGVLLSVLGPDHRNGAGVLHVYPESPTEVLSCGYDTYVRLWDVRSPAQCVRSWEDPHDSTVYCVASDHNVTVLSGTNRYGVVRLWDKRMTQQVQMYYVGRGNSPVYSLAFDPCFMYVALDHYLKMLTFTGSSWVLPAID